MRDTDARALEIAEGEAGTLHYAWFFNDDETTCVVRETYEDSDAVLAHVANLGELGGLVEVGGGCEFEVLGRPSAELVEATRGLDLTVFPPRASSASPRRALWGHSRSIWSSAEAGGDRDFVISGVKVARRVRARTLLEEDRRETQRGDRLARLRASTFRVGATASAVGPRPYSHGPRALSARRATIGE